MKSGKLTEQNEHRIVVDKRAIDIWKQIEIEDNMVDERNWLCLSYSTPRELVLTGSGNEGFEEAVETFKDDRISFCVMMGCKLKGRTLLDLIRVVFMWIPYSEGPLKRARALLDADEIVNSLEMKVFCLCGAGKKDEVNMEKLIDEVTEINEGKQTVKTRGTKYVFDGSTYRYRKDKFYRSIETSLRVDQNFRKRYSEFRRKETLILRELITTERHYNICLATLNDKYVKPLETHGYKKEYSFIHSMVNTIIRVNADFYESLLKEYNLNQNMNETEFMQNLDKLTGDFFTKDKVAKIVDISFVHFKTFKFYGPYVSSYNKMYKKYVTLLEKDKNLQILFTQTQTELELSGERNSHFLSFLIIPVQRIPRYQLMFKELLKTVTFEDENYERILKTMEEVKKISIVVNANMESLIMVTKTIHLSKMLKKPELMSLKMVRFKSIEQVKQKDVSERTHKFGEIYVFDSLLLVVQMTKKKKKKKKKRKGKKVVEKWGNISMFSSTSVSSSGIRDLENFKLKLLYELDLKNPISRCYRNHQIREILDLEDETKKYSVRMESSEVCEEMVSVVQEQLLRYNAHQSMSSLYATRVLYKSVLTVKNESFYEEKEFLTLLCADMKLKFYDESNPVTMLRSYSLVGSTYGITNKERIGETRRKRNRGSKFLFGSGGSFSGSGYLMDLPYTNEIIFGETGEKGGRKKNKKKSNYYYFYVTFPIVMKNKKKKKKKKEQQQQQQQQAKLGEKGEKKMFFSTQEKEVLEVWMGVLGMIGCCSRIDESTLEEEVEEEEEGEEEFDDDEEEEGEIPTPSLLRNSQTRRDMDGIRKVLEVSDESENQRQKEDDKKKMKPAFGSSPPPLPKSAPPSKRPKIVRKRKVESITEEQKQ